MVSKLLWLCNWSNLGQLGQLHPLRFKFGYYDSNLLFEFCKQKIALFLYSDINAIYYCLLFYEYDWTLHDLAAKRG